MSSKYNFDAWNEYKEKEEDNAMGSIKNTEVKDIKKDNKDIKKTELSLHDEMDKLEKRIYGFMKPCMEEIRLIDKNVQKLVLDKTITAVVKDLKKKGYEFENEDEVLEQLEVNYLMGLGFKFNKNEGDEK